MGINNTMNSNADLLVDLGSQNNADSQVDLGKVKQSHSAKDLVQTLQHSQDQQFRESNNINYHLNETAQSKIIKKQNSPTNLAEQVNKNMQQAERAQLDIDSCNDHGFQQNRAATYYQKTSLNAKQGKRAISVTNANLIRSQRAPMHSKSFQGCKYRMTQKKAQQLINLKRQQEKHQTIDNMLIQQEQAHFFNAYTINSNANPYALSPHYQQQDATYFNHQEKEQSQIYRFNEHVDTDQKALGLNQKTNHQNEHQEQQKSSVYKERQEERYNFSVYQNKPNAVSQLIFNSKPQLKPKNSNLKETCNVDGSLNQFILSQKKSMDSATLYIVNSNNKLNRSNKIEAGAKFQQPQSHLQSTNANPKNRGHGHNSSLVVSSEGAVQTLAKSSAQSPLSRLQNNVSKAKQTASALQDALQVVSDQKPCDQTSDHALQQSHYDQSKLSGSVRKDPNASLGGKQQLLIVEKDSNQSNSINKKQAYTAEKKNESDQFQEPEHTKLRSQKSFHLEGGQTINQEEIKEYKNPIFVDAQDQNNNQAIHQQNLPKLQKGSSNDRNRIVVIHSNVKKPSYNMHQSDNMMNTINNEAGGGAIENLNDSFIGQQQHMVATQLDSQLQDFQENQSMLAENKTQQNMNNSSQYLLQKQASQSQITNQAEVERPKNITQIHIESQKKISDKLISKKYKTHQHISGTGGAGHAYQNQSTLSSSKMMANRSSYQMPTILMQSYYQHRDESTGAHKGEATKSGQPRRAQVEYKQQPMILYNHQSMSQKDMEMKERTQAKSSEMMNRTDTNLNQSSKASKFKSNKFQRKSSNGKAGYQMQQGNATHYMGSNQMRFYYNNSVQQAFLKKRRQLQSQNQGHRNAISLDNTREQTYLDHNDYISKEIQMKESAQIYQTGQDSNQNQKSNIHQWQNNLVGNDGNYRESISGTQTPLSNTNLSNVSHANPLMSFMKNSQQFAGKQGHHPKSINLKYEGLEISKYEIQELQNSAASKKNSQVGAPSVLSNKHSQDPSLLQGQQVLVTKSISKIRNHQTKQMVNTLYQNDNLQRQSTNKSSTHNVHCEGSKKDEIQSSSLQANIGLKLQGQENKAIAKDVFNAYLNKNLEEQDINMQVERGSQKSRRSVSPPQNHKISSSSHQAAQVIQRKKASKTSHQQARPAIALGQGIQSESVYNPAASHHQLNTKQGSQAGARQQSNNGGLRQRKLSSQQQQHLHIQESNYQLVSKRQKYIKHMLTNKDSVLSSQPQDQAQNQSQNSSIQFETQFQEAYKQSAQTSGQPAIQKSLANFPGGAAQKQSTNSSQGQASLNDFVQGTSQKLHKRSKTELYQYYKKSMQIEKQFQLEQKQMHLQQQQQNARPVHKIINMNNQPMIVRGSVELSSSNRQNKFEDSQHFKMDATKDLAAVDSNHQDTSDRQLHNQFQLEKKVSSFNDNIGHTEMFRRDSQQPEVQLDQIEHNPSGKNRQKYNNESSFVDQISPQQTQAKPDELNEQAVPHLIVNKKFTSFKMGQDTQRIKEQSSMNITQQEGAEMLQQLRQNNIHIRSDVEDILNNSGQLVNPENKIVSKVQNATNLELQEKKNFVQLNKLNVKNALQSSKQKQKHFQNSSQYSSSSNQQLLKNQYPPQTKSMDSQTCSPLAKTTASLAHNQLKQAGDAHGHLQAHLAWPKHGAAGQPVTGGDHQVNSHYQQDQRNRGLAQGLTTSHANVQCADSSGLQQHGHTFHHAEKDMKQLLVRQTSLIEKCKLKDKQSLKETQQNPNKHDIDFLRRMDTAHKDVKSYQSMPKKLDKIDQVQSKKFKDTELQQVNKQAIGNKGNNQEKFASNLQEQQNRNILILQEAQNNEPRIIESLKQPQSQSHNQTLQDQNQSKECSYKEQQNLMTFYGYFAYKETEMKTIESKGLKPSLDQQMHFLTQDGGKSLYSAQKAATQQYIKSLNKNVSLPQSTINSNHDHNPYNHPQIQAELKPWQYQGESKEVQAGSQLDQDMQRKAKLILQHQQLSSENDQPHGGFGVKKSIQLRNDFNKQITSTLSIQQHPFCHPADNQLSCQATQQQLNVQGKYIKQTQYSMMPSNQVQIQNLNQNQTSQHFYKVKKNSQLVKMVSKECSQTPSLLEQKLKNGTENDQELMNRRLQQLLSKDSFQDSRQSPSHGINKNIYKPMDTSSTPMMYKTREGNNAFYQLQDSPEQTNQKQFNKDLEAEFGEAMDPNSELQKKENTLSPEHDASKTETKKNKKSKSAIRMQLVEFNPSESRQNQTNAKIANHK